MATLLFIYNLLLTITFAGLMSGYFFINHNRKNKLNAMIGVLLLILMVDHGLIYFSEFAMSQERFVQFQSSILYGLDVLYFGFIALTRIIYGEIYKAPLLKVEKGLLITVPLTLIGMGQVLDVAVYDFIITVVIYIAIGYLAYKFYTRNKTEKVLMILAVLACLVGIVDGFIISFGITFNYPAFINQLEVRDIAFDLIKLIVCYISMRYLFQQFNHMLVVQEITLEETQKIQQDEIQRPIDKLEIFSEKYNLTQRQKEIVECIMAGKTNKEISEALYITEGTVKTHIYNIFKKTDASNRNQLVSIIHNED